MRAARPLLFVLGLLPAWLAAQPVQTGVYREVMTGSLTPLIVTSWREDVGDGTTRHWLTGTTLPLGWAGVDSSNPDLVSLTMSHRARLYLVGGYTDYLLYIVTGSDPAARYDFTTAPIVTAVGDPLPWLSPGLPDPQVSWLFGGQMISSYQAVYRDRITGTIHRDQDIITPSLAFRPVTTAPEPSTWALLGTGLLAVGGVAVRRRRH